MGISLDLLYTHLKSDKEPEEVALITQYLESAQSMCETACNRKFYDSEADRDGDMTQAIQDYAALKTKRNDMLATLDETDCEAIRMVWDHYREDKGKIMARVQGCVIDGTLVAAIMRTAGNLYVDRTATEVPPGVLRMLDGYIAIGSFG